MLACKEEKKRETDVATGMLGEMIDELDTYMLSELCSLSM